MAEHTGEWFRDKPVELDGEEFYDCTFVDCNLIYRGGEPPVILDGSFVRCEWFLEDAALRTLGFFMALNIIGADDVLRGWIDMILNTRVLPPRPEDPLQ